LYKRLASVESDADLYGLQEEIIDRFGKLPPAAQALVETHRLRLRADAMGLTKIDVAGEIGHLHFNKNAPIDGIKIIQLIQSERNVQLNGQDKLKLTYKMPELKDRVARVNQVLDALKS
jgi:transcription-repair coupling factor (superfamily II helicase)